MNPLPWWAKTLALGGCLSAAYWWGAINTRTECALSVASRDIEAYGAQVAAQARIDFADHALAEKQAVILQGVAVETIRYKVVYRDRIQDPATVGCIADSGLLELYRAAHGFTVGASGYVDTKGGIARPRK